MCNKTKTYVWKLQRLLVNNKTVYRSQERLRSYYHVMYTEEVKAALSSNDDKRQQTADNITTYPYETSEMMMINK